MGGKEKMILVIANVPNYQGSHKKSQCNESVSKKNGVSSSRMPPPIPMSPIVEKMEGLKAIRNRSNSLRLGRLAFYRHLEKVETMRSFWELKHVELEGGNQQVKDNKAKDGKDKAKLNLKGLKAQKKRKPPDTQDSSSLNEPDQVEKLNRQNTEHSYGNVEAGSQNGEARGGGRQEQVELILDASTAQREEKKKNAEVREEEDEVDLFEDSESEVEEVKAEEKKEAVSPEQAGEVEDDGKKRRDEEAGGTSKPEVSGVVPDIPAQTCTPTLSAQERYVHKVTGRHHHHHHHHHHHLHFPALH
ncbi:hypothetical protein LDENG_00115680 [Lucifuga dentata]|nr:hypothetical protein LDENG_00115680 [Lucifuga dentata]